jgi:hypothetical protein
VVFSILMYAAPVLAGATDEASQAASSSWEAVWRIGIYWVPFFAFIVVWIWLFRRMYSSSRGGYFGYVKRSLEHMERVEQKLDSIRELLERNQQSK